MEIKILYIYNTKSNVIVGERGRDRGGEEGERRGTG